MLNGILGPDLGDSVYCVVVDFTVRAKANLDLDRFYNPRSGKVVVCRAFLRALKSEPFVGNSVLTCAVIGFSRAESPIKLEFELKSSETLFLTCADGRPSTSRKPNQIQKRDIWLILPVVICLSQRLSHACLSTSHIKVKPRMAH